MKSEIEIEWPKVTLGKHLPSFTDEEMWSFVGERGVYSSKPEFFKYCFDIFIHKDGLFLYRMKPKKEYSFSVKENKEGGIFAGTVFHDPMGSIITREDSDDIEIISTHSDGGEEYDVLENWCNIPYENIEKLLECSNLKETIRHILKNK